MENKDNVVRFPVEKARPSKLGGWQKQKLQDRQKMVISSVLLLVLVATVVLREYREESAVAELASSSLPDYGSRQIASVEESQTDEIAMTNLSSLDERTPASFGRAPTGAEKLVMEDLNRRYRIIYDGEYVRELSLDGKDPVFIKDPEEFLTQHQALFGANVTSIVPVGGQKNETNELGEYEYSVLVGDTVSATLRLKMDNSGRFYSLKVESVRNKSDKKS